MRNYLTREDLDHYMTNLSLHDRKVDSFYASFLGMPENVSDILSRQLIDCSRPDLNFEFSEFSHRGNRYKDKAFVRFEPITLRFADDENSITSHVLYGQIFRQLNKHPDIFGNIDAGEDREIRFGIKLELFNSTDKVVEAYQFDKCFISSLKHADSSITDKSDSSIDVTIQFDNISILTFDQWIEVI